MRVRSRGSIAIAVLFIVILGFFLPPLINVNRYRGRIADTIARALDRPVTVGSISLRIFPQPGFDLGNVSVGEDPAFGYEPMLHAEEVSARLRLSSLWRGRLEIAKLSLKYPSLNLVRADDGRWNLESLLQRATQMATAPTGKTRPEARPRFPYIEADGGRINFKIGLEKKVYALSDADFSLWLASEDELRTRLKGRMIRTDSDLSDTGQISFNGRFQRAFDLRDTPLEITASLQKAQLGQLTKFIDGQDHGWRGEVDANITIAGRPAALKVAANTAINDFRRYDIYTTENLRLNARCSAVLDAPAQAFSDLSCDLPMGNGGVKIAGKVDGLSSVRSYEVNVAATNIPAQSVIALVRHAKKDIPEDLTATGTFDATMALRKDGPAEPSNWSGGGITSGIVLQSAALRPDIELKPLQFSVGVPKPAVNRVKNTGRGAIRERTADYNRSPRLVVSPFVVDLGGESPATFAAWFDPNGYEFDVNGDSQLTRIFQIAHVAGIKIPEVNGDGKARVALAIGGAWQGFLSPKPIGSAQLRGVTVRMKGIAEPLRLASATLNLAQGAVTASAISAEFTQAKLALTGSIQLPRECEPLESCWIEFDLRSDQLSTDALNRLLNPHAAKRPWYAILGGRPEPSILSSIHGSGHISAGKLLMKSFVANHVRAIASLNNGDIVLSDLRGEVLGGKHVGQWVARFSGDKPTYEGTGILDSVAMAELSSFMHDNWAAGKLSGTYKMTMSGDTVPQMVSSTKGELAFNWRGGALRHVVLGNKTAPLSFRRFSGALGWNGTSIQLAASRMETSSGIYEVSGTASSARDVDLTLRSGSHAFELTGTLDRPKVSPAPVTKTQVSFRQ